MFSSKSSMFLAGLAAAFMAVNTVNVTPANSASNLCTKRTAMIDALARKYHEERRGIGIASRAGVMEFYVSASGTWTVLMTMPNGMSCILAAGRDWEDMAATPAGTNS